MLRICSAEPVSGVDSSTGRNEHEEHPGTMSVRGFPLTLLAGERPISIRDEASKVKMAATATCFACGADDKLGLEGWRSGGKVRREF